MNMRVQSGVGPAGRRHCPGRSNLQLRWEAFQNCKPDFSYLQNFFDKLLQLNILHPSEPLFFIDEGKENTSLISRLIGHNAPGFIKPGSCDYLRSSYLLNASAYSVVHGL